jgi:hypothetical protein
MNSLTLWDVDFDVKNVCPSKTRWGSFDFLMADRYLGSVREPEGFHVSLARTGVYRSVRSPVPGYVDWWWPAHSRTLEPRTALFPFGPQVNSVFDSFGQGEPGG